MAATLALPSTVALPFSSEAVLGFTRRLRSPWKALSVVCCKRSESEGSISLETGVRGQQAVACKQPMFTDASHLIAVNPAKLHYGVCVADLDGDGESELFVCGFGAENQLLKWTGKELVNIAIGTPLQDPDSKSIGVAAADFDGDGQEELYILNADTFLGRKKVTDRLFDRQQFSWVDLFSMPMNMDDSNMCAGRSVCCVDRKGTGKYGFFVANYGGFMKLFELSEEGFVADVASEAGLVTYPTGGRALVALPLISHSTMDIFAGNEGGPNFLFCDKGDNRGHYVECAAAYGLMDTMENCRGVAVVDVKGNGELGLACGNWQGPHRLYAPSGPGPVGGARALGFNDADMGGFVDVAPSDMAQPSAIRTVIAADFDNDGYEELFFNNIGDNNRLFRQNGAGNWIEGEIGDAKEPKGLGTGAAVADIDGDGRLELLISHGELRPQPLSLYRSPENDNAWIRVRPLTMQGAPARGASVKLYDETGRIQKRVIDAGRMRPEDRGLTMRKETARISVFVGWDFLDLAAHKSRNLTRRKCHPHLAEKSCLILAEADEGIVVPVSGIGGLQRHMDSGYLCCMEPVAHFGLGQLQGPVKLLVTWPDGTSLEMVDVAPRQLICVPHP